MDQSTLSDSDRIRERLIQFIKENPSASIRTVAGEIGMSASYVSLFKNNKFPTKESEPALASKIESYLNNHEAALENAVSTGHLKFAMTTASQEIFKAAQYAQREHKITVIVGVPGSGKTISAKNYQQQNPNSILIEIPAIVSKRTILQDIATAVKLPIYSFNRDERQISIPSAILFREIVEKLKGTNRLLIGDEGENLSTGCLEIIRRIHDFTGVGILLSGTKRLLDKLRGPRRELQQLYSRVGYCHEIDLLKIGDVRAILQANFPGALKFANNFLQLSKNNGRVLEHLIDLVKKDLRETGEDLNEDTIDLAAQSLLN
jgi:DNA transposition AAA+ family ATPase